MSSLGLDAVAVSYGKRPAQDVAGHRLVVTALGPEVADVGRPAESVLRAETLAEFYGVRVTVHHEPDGTVVVLPRRDPV